MSNSTITPSSYVPFSSIYYISAPDGAGDNLVVGSMITANYSGLDGVPVPNAVNQQFCNPITLAPGIVVTAYVPTAAERLGNFSAFNGLLFDPTCGATCPYPNGQIPYNVIPSVFAWRIPPGPPVYVSTFTGHQVLAVDGNSGVTSVLFTDPAGDDLEGLAVGPDNLIYAAAPHNNRIIRIDQSGGSFATVYDLSTDPTGPTEPQGPSFGTTGLLTFNSDNTEGGDGVWQISFSSTDAPGTPVQIIAPAYGAVVGEGTTFNLADELLIVDQYYRYVLQQTGPGASTTSQLITSNLSTPIGVATNSSGNIFVSNLNNCFYCQFVNGGNIAQFTSAGGFVNTYATFAAPDAPTYMQFDASGNLYVVTVQDETFVHGRVWRLPPPVPPATTSTPLLLVDLNTLYSGGTIGLSSDTAMGLALPATTFTTPPQPVAPGIPVTFTYGNIINQTVSIPSRSSTGGAAYIAVNFQQWNPTVFDTTRLPATSTNTWSGGIAVPNGTTCTPIAGTGGNCMVIEDLCFDSNNNPILPCKIFAPSGTLIGLTSMYQTQSPQLSPALIIADDGGNDWANITTGYSATDPTIRGGTNSLNTDTAIVNLSGSTPTVSFTGAPATAAYQSSFPVTATTNASTAAVITASGVCSVTGTPVTATSSTGTVTATTVTMTSGTGTCSLTAYWPADANYAAAYATQSTSATTVTPGPLASASPSIIYFGTVYLGTITIKSVTLTNLGTAPMTITDTFLSILSGGNSKEFVAVNLCPKSLAAGKSCTISVIFVAGPYYTPQTATLKVMDNAPGSPQTVALIATVINPKASLSSYSLNFGKQAVRTRSAAKRVTLTNTGTTPLVLSTLTVSRDFALASGTTCVKGGTLAANASCTINVTFGPTARGLRSGSVVITDNAQNSPQNISLSGTGD
jgi:hypothetical protein